MLWTAVIVLGAGYVLLVAAVYFRQEQLVYRSEAGGRELAVTPRERGLEFESVKVVTTDGVALSGWFVPAPQPRGVVLFFHGNAGNISHRIDWIAVFNRLGFSVLIFDYRGYGLSQGSPTEQGTYLDAQAMWHYLTQQRNVPAQQIVFFGESLGGAVAAWMAARSTPRALILLASFTSIPDMAAALYPYLPARRLARLRYDNVASLAHVACPVLVIHSPADELVPFAHGRILFDTVRGQKRFLEIRGGHNDAMELNEEILAAGIAEFLGSALPTHP
ncbi:MAG: alpha/beta hydrolase [Burkholderiales bacterium]